MANLEKKSEDEWELSDIPDLLNELIYLCDRLEDEQNNACTLLASCRKGWFMYSNAINSEDRRLRGNIEFAYKRKKFWQDALVGFSKEQMKKDES